MADIRSSQVVAQVEWQVPGLIKASQVIAQIEYVKPAFGEYTGNVTLSLTPAAVASSHFVYEGDVSLSLSPAAETGSGNWCSGDVTLSLTPAATTVVGFVYVGDVTLVLVSSSVVVGDYGYDGSVFIKLTPEGKYAIPIPGFDHWYGYGLVDLTFLDGNPPYYCIETEVDLSLTPEGDYSLYKEFILEASGGLKISGEGEVAFFTPSIYSVVGVGGSIIGGEGIAVFILPPIYTVVAKGGLEISGDGSLTFVEAPVDLIYTVVGSGGYDLSGRGIFTFINILPIFTLVGLGGYKLSGIGTATFEDPEIVEYILVGSGGYKLEGEGGFVYVTPDKVFSLIGTGEILLSGAGGLAWFDPEYFSVIGSGGVVISGGGTDEEFIYFTWVFSGVDYKPSIYSGYDFNSYCTFGGKIYGANEIGIFELGGETDDGVDIHTGFVLGPHNLGVNNKKRLRSIHLGNKNIATRVRVTLDTTSKDFSVTKGKAKITRNLMGEEVTLEVADFKELSVIEVTPVVLGLRG